MSLAQTKEAGDPYASKAWAASQAVIALEKLSLGLSLGESNHRDLGLDLSIEDEELDSFDIVATEMKLLSKAKQIPAGDLLRGNSQPLSSDLRESLYTLVAIEQDVALPIGWSEFEQAAEDLSLIRHHVQVGTAMGLDTDVLERAKKVCLEFLDHLDKQRPNISVHSIH